VSRFGDGSYKQEIFDNLHWIIYNLKPEVLEPKEQLEFIHQNIIYLITKQYDKLNWFIKEEGAKRNYSYKEMLKELGEIYQVMTEYDFELLEEI